MTPGVDVIVVSYNTSAELQGSLASIFAAPPAGLQTVFVVDNGSADDSVTAVRGRWPQVRVLALGRNTGFAAANNAALREARADLVLLLNSDTIAPAGAIDRLVERVVATGAAAAGPRLVDASGRPELSFGRMLSPLAEAAQLLRGRVAASRAAWARRRVTSWLARERDVDWVSGACLLVRRSAALAAGLMDERYFMYEEDVDFCAALRAQGGRVLFTPAAEIVHLRGRSSPGGGAARDHYDRSHLAFYLKHRPGWAPWLRAWMRLRGRGIR